MSVVVTVALVFSGGALISTQLLAHHPSLILVALAATAVVAVHFRFGAGENLRTLNLVTTATLGVSIAVLLPTAAGGVVLLAGAFYREQRRIRIFLTQLVVGVVLLTALSLLLRMPVWFLPPESWSVAWLAVYGAWAVTVVSLVLFASQWTLNYRSGALTSQLMFAADSDPGALPRYLNALSIFSMATTVAAVATGAVFVQISQHGHSLAWFSVLLATLLTAVAVYAAVQSVVGLQWGRVRSASISRREEWLTRLVQRQDENRQRMTAHLHDEPLQDVIASVTLLDIYQHSEDRELLTQSQQLLLSAVDRIRQLMLEGGDTPQVLVRLSTALRQLADDLPIDVTVTIDGDSDGRPASAGSGGTWSRSHIDSLPVETKRGLYLIVREALMNCFKHAQATEVSVDVSRRDNSVVVRVSDNGVGFTVHEATGDGHLGMVLMQARALVIGAQLSVSSAPDEGTVMTVTLPDLPSGSKTPGAESHHLNSDFYLDAPESPVLQGRDEWRGLTH